MLPVSTGPVFLIEPIGIGTDSMNILIPALLLVFTSVPARAGDVLPVLDASDGLRQILVQNASTAAAKLGTVNGFLENPKVRIPLPKSLRKAEGLLRTLGMGEKVDELTVAMNHAAEQAVPEASTLVADAVNQMSFQDAKTMMAGGDDAVTQYFRQKTADSLLQKFIPVIKKATDQMALAKQYNEVAGYGLKTGLLSEKKATIESYVAQKTLDGLYLMMAEEERALRVNPTGKAGELLQNILRLSQ